MTQDIERSRAYAAAHNRKRRALGRAALQKLKADPCMDCGGKFPVVCMQYDHRDPSLKRQKVSHYAGNGEIAKMLEEIALCDLVCANCHAVRTEARRIAALLPEQQLA